MLLIFTATRNTCGTDIHMQTKHSYTQYKNKSLKKKMLFIEPKKVQAMVVPARRLRHPAETVCVEVSRLPGSLNLALH